MASANESSLTVEMLHQCFLAEPETGRVYHRRRPRDHFLHDNGWKVFNSSFAGKEAIATRHDYGCESTLTLCGVKYRLIRSRVIWAMARGAWPKLDIGHRNGDHFDDRIENLREQTHSQRGTFARSRGNKTGVRGVYLTREGRFTAAIRNEDRQQHIGTYDTMAEAKAAYEATALELRGEFARITDPFSLDEGAGP